jgi:hypothetical protein
MSDDTRAVTDGETAAALRTRGYRQVVDANTLTPEHTERPTPKWFRNASRWEDAEPTLTGWKRSLVNISITVTISGVITLAAMEVMSHLSDVTVDGAALPPVTIWDGLGVLLIVVIIWLGIVWAPRVLPPMGAWRR